MLRRVILSPYFRLMIGAVLVLSCLTEISQELPRAFPVGKVHVVLLWGFLHVMVASGMVLEGVKKIGSVDMVRKHFLPLARMTHAVYFALIVGVLLVAGSLFELVLEVEEFPTLSSTHGVLVYAFFSLVLTISHLLKGAGEMATATPNSRWTRIGELVEHPAVEVTAAFALLVSSLVEIWDGLGGAVELKAAHGLAVFALASIVESIVFSISELEEVEQHYSGT